jgi:hypothetical protein
MMQLPPPPGFEPTPFDQAMSFWIAYLTLLFMAILALPEKWRERVADIAFGRR